MKQTFIVKAPVTHYREVQIEADSPEDARQKVSNGEGDPIGYWRACLNPADLDIRNWKVRGKKDKSFRT